MTIETVMEDGKQWSWKGRLILNCYGDAIDNGWLDVGG